MENERDENAAAVTVDRTGKPVLNHHNPLKPSMKRKVQVAALLTDPTRKLTQKQVAEILRVDPRTVRRDVRAIRDAVTDADRLMEQWNTRMEARLPIDSRVDLLGALCEQDEHLPTKLKALQYANSLAGIAATGAQPDSTPVQPLFTLPPGARVAVRVD